MQPSRENKGSNERINPSKKHGIFSEIRENILLFFDGLCFLSLLWKESTNENTDRR